MHQIRLPPEDHLERAAPDIQARNFGMLHYAHVFGLQSSASAEALAEAQDCLPCMKVSMAVIADEAYHTIIATTVNMQIWRGIC